jgi:hypothetical protein
MHFSSHKFNKTIAQDPSFDKYEKVNINLWQFFLINHGRTVQRKTTIISFTCIAEINYIHKVIHSNIQ